MMISTMISINDFHQYVLFYLMANNKEVLPTQNLIHRLSYWAKRFSLIDSVKDIQMIYFKNTNTIIHNTNLLYQYRSENADIKKKHVIKTKACRENIFSIRKKVTFLNVYKRSLPILLGKITTVGKLHTHI